MPVFRNLLSQHLHNQPSQTHKCNICSPSSCEHDVKKYRPPVQIRQITHPHEISSPLSSHVSLCNPATEHNIFHLYSPHHYNRILFHHALFPHPWKRSNGRLLSLHRLLWYIQYDWRWRIWFCCRQTHI